MIDEKDVIFINIRFLLRCLIDLQTLHIYGMQSNNQQRPVLIMGTISLDSPFIHIEFELFPVDKKSDYRLCLVIEPLKFFYDAVSLKKQPILFYLIRSF